MNSKINVVLVHGAWADGSCWSKVIPLLEAEGYEVSAAQIPLTSLEDDIAVTRRLLSRQQGPTVLVGHSYGGAVISGAANDVSNVKALVYIAATGVDEGESLDSLSKQGPLPAGFGYVRADDDGYLWFDKAGFPTAYAADLDKTEAAVMAAVQKPVTLLSFTSQAGPPAWKKLPSWYLIATEDEMLSPSAQEFMAKRMGATVNSVPASHALVLSRPQEVADIILSAAQSIA
jgi:pimeloyl-ACP methyl ester carboxylesterase